MSNYYDSEGNRKIPYKEDSTKGQSMIDPISYKGDVMVQVWLDARIIATMARWLEEQGAYPRFMSDCVRSPLEVLAEMLVSNAKVEMITSTIEARQFLEQRFKVKLNKGKGGKNVLHNQVLSDKVGSLVGKKDSYLRLEEDDFVDHSLSRDREVAERENQPIDIEFLKKGEGK